MSRVASFRLNKPEDPISDRELIQRTLGGDANAYATLVDRFQRAIHRVAFAIVRDEGDADTITQDTFVQAYLSLAKFEGRAELETWLTRIAINKARDVLRRRRVALFFHRSDDGETPFEPPDERPDPERLYAATQLRIAIQRAEGRLSAQQQLIFRLRHYEDLPLERIAENLGLSAGTVRAHLFRAIQKIRRELAGWSRP